jgi:hypothetical protein
MTPTIFELQQQKAAKEAEILNQTFRYGVDSGTQIAESLGNANQLKRELSETAFKQWVSGRLHDFAHETRRQLKQEYVDLESWYAEQVQKRVVEVEEMLWSSVSSADPALLLQFSSASEERLLDALETARSTQNTAALELILKVAYDKDFDLLISRAIDDNEELEGLFAELSEADKLPDYAPEEKFEMLAREVGSPSDLLIQAGDVLSTEYGIPKRASIY